MLLEIIHKIVFNVWKPKNNVKSTIFINFDDTPAIQAHLIHIAEIKDIVFFYFNNEFSTQAHLKQIAEMKTPHPN